MSVGEVDDDDDVDVDVDVDEDADADEDDDDEELDMFNRLDRKLRRAYAELLATEIEIVPPHQKYQEAKIQFEEMLNL